MDTGKVPTRYDDLMERYAVREIERQGRSKATDALRDIIKLCLAKLGQPASAPDPKASPLSDDPQSTRYAVELTIGSAGTARVEVHWHRASSGWKLAIAASATQQAVGVDGEKQWIPIREGGAIESIAASLYEALKADASSA